jgi:hypothetical protein
MEELRTQAEYQSANDPLGLPEAAAQEIVNRLLDFGDIAPVSKGANLTHDRRCAVVEP